MEIDVSKIGAAVDQLDWAIRLLLDHRAYVPAITLAGAAEEILGKAVSGESAHATMKATFAADLSMRPKVVSDEHLNKARNWLKHGDGTATETASFDLEGEAIQYICRALTNLSDHNDTWPSEGARFAIWMQQNRPDLMNDDEMDG